MLNFVPHHLKEKKMCKYAVKKLQFVTMYFPDWFQTQEICGEVILENGGMLRLNPDCYKNENICDKAVDD